jgi:hypothetical protein
LRSLASQTDQSIRNRVRARGSNDQTFAIMRREGAINFRDLIGKPRPSSALTGETAERGRGSELLSGHQLTRIMQNQC